MSSKVKQQQAQKKATPRASPWAAVFIGSVIAACAIIVHVPAMHADYVWDDDMLLYNNQLIKRPEGLQRFWFTAQADDYFPLTYTLLWTEWRLWGNNPHDYHVVNILLHAGAAVLLWRIFKRLKVPAAWLGGLIFAVHPVATSSVAWISEQKNTLAMVFYLSAALEYLRYEDNGRKRDYAFALGLFLLALCSKSSVVILAPALVLCVWWRRGAFKWVDAKRLAPFFAAALLFGCIQVYFHHIKSTGQGPVDPNLPLSSIHKYVVARPEGFASRLAAAGWAVWFYLGKDLYPHPLVMVYKRWNVDPAQPAAWLPLAALALTFAALWWKRKTWGRTPLFVFGYFVIALGPIVGFFEVSYMEYSLVADHWQYIALPAIAGLAAGIAGTLWRSAAWRTLVGPATVGVLAALCVLAWNHSGDFKSQEAMWRHNIKYNDFGACHVNLGAILGGRGDIYGAMKEYDRALELNPILSVADFNLGMSYLRLSQENGLTIERKRELLDKSVAHFKRRAELNPDDTSKRMLESVLSMRRALDQSK